MTLPVEDDDLLSGATKYLLSIDEVVDLVGADELGPFIWQEFPLRNMEKRSDTAIVVTTSSISIIDEAHTQHFERLGIEIWAGPIRDAGGNVIEPAEVRRRVNKVYKIVDRYLHRPQGGEQMWGTIRTHTCERITGLDREPPPDGTEMLVGRVFYVVQLD